MKSTWVIFFTIFFFVSNAFGSSLQKLFYVTPDVTDYSFSNGQLQNIKKYAKSIDIIAPQIYQLNENGVVQGNIDNRLITIAKENNLKIMPLITNTKFDQDKFHDFLRNPTAQERAMANMISLCEQYKFYGIQFDFENININDKTEFTRFIQLAANRLHQNNFKVSIAVVPRISDIVYTDYGRWAFENWSGAYDYRALSQSCDFISVMSYDRHTTFTTPGPLAAHDWVETTIQHLLKVIPADKLSLGIPDYSGYWFTGVLDPTKGAERYKYRSRELQISYPKVLSLLDQFNQKLVWQNQWKSSYVMYVNNGLTEYLFVEDAKSFKAKLQLAKHYHLHGISVWKFGLEDPEIWHNPDLLP